MGNVSGIQSLYLHYPIESEGRSRALTNSGQPDYGSSNSNNPDTSNKALMQKAMTTKITKTSRFHNSAAADLADMHGRLGAEIAELEARRKAIADEMIARGIRHIEGGLFESTVVGETMVANIDRQAIERDMGEDWLAKYLKWSKRCASIRTTSRDAAA